MAKLRQIGWLGVSLALGGCLAVGAGDDGHGAQSQLSGDLVFGGVDTTSDVGGGSTGTAEKLPPAQDERSCDDDRVCFSWCGVDRRTGPCVLGNGAVSPTDDLLCDRVELQVLADGTVRDLDLSGDAARCFMRVLRFGNLGTVALAWYDEHESRRAVLEVEMLEPQVAHLEMWMEKPAVDCGSGIGLTALRAHVVDEYDLVFRECLDGELRPGRCLLGLAAGFFDDFDVAYDLPFPWLSGACLP